VIDGTGGPLAGAARDGLSQHTLFREVTRRVARVGRTHQDHDRTAESDRDVSWSGVIAEHELRAGDQGLELGQRESVSAETDRVHLGSGGDPGSDFHLVGRRGEDRSQAVLPGDRVAGPGKVFGGPELAGAEAGARGHDEQGFVGSDAIAPQLPVDAFHGRRVHGEIEVIAGILASDVPGDGEVAIQHWNRETPSVLAGRRQRVAEERPAQGIAGVSHPSGNPGEERSEGGSGRVGQQNGELESALGEPSPSHEYAESIIGEEGVEGIDSPQQIGEDRPSFDDDLGPGMSGAQRA
jgi:hypothetical protein